MWEQQKKFVAIVLSMLAIATDVRTESASQTISRSTLKRARIAWLPKRYRLVGLENHLFRIDSRRRVIWAHKEFQVLFDFAFVDSTGLVYVTAGDNNFFILDATTGEELHRESRNGSAAFGEVRPYGRDQCLVTDYNGGYRDRNFRDMPDGVSAWRGVKMLWHREIPAEASIQVNGREIYAVYKRKGVTIRKRILPPPQSSIMDRRRLTNACTRAPRSEVRVVSLSARRGPRDAGR